MWFLREPAAVIAMTHVMKGIGGESIGNATFSVYRDRLVFGERKIAHCECLAHFV